MSALAARLTVIPSVVPHTDNSIGCAEEAAAVRVLRSGRLAPGPEAARLEKLLVRLTDGADAVSLSSGGLALTLALRALALGPGDRVALPSFAGAGLLHAVRAAGAVPLICDIDPQTLALSLSDLDRRAGRRLRAAVVGHPGGRPIAVRPFLARGLKVVEDCGEALGAAFDGRPVGGWGNAAVLSFAPGGLLTCGGPGGAVASRQASLVRAVRDDTTGHARPLRAGGSDGLMGDLHAAIATVQVERLPEFIARRAAIAARYDAAFRSIRLASPPAEDRCRSVSCRYLIRVPDAGQVIDALRQRGILAQRPVARPLHDLLGLRSRFPATDAARAEIVSLPLYPSLQDRDVERIVDTMSHILA